MGITWILKKMTGWWHVIWFHSYVVTKYKTVNAISDSFSPLVLYCQLYDFLLFKLEFEFTNFFFTYRHSINYLLLRNYDNHSEYYKITEFTTEF